MRKITFCLFVAGCVNGGVEARREMLWGGSDDSDALEANVVVRLGGGGCTGTLITPSVVLTAKHCINGTCDSQGCRPGVGRTPLVEIGGLGSELSLPGHQITTNRVPPWTPDAQPWDVDFADGLDMALVFLDQPVLELAKIERPSLTPPTWPGDVNGGLYAGTFGFAGWSPFGQDEVTPRFVNRQVALFSPIELEHEPCYNELTTGQEWIKDALVAGTDGGDSGGPLFHVRNDAGCAARADCGTRDVMGIASYISDNVGDTDDHFTDVTRGWPRRLVATAAEDHSHDNSPIWMSMHPRMVPATIPGTTIEKWQSATGPRWKGEVDYTGPCQHDFDRDCDHWYDEHDNCPDQINVDQADGDDNGRGDACPLPPPPTPSNCVIWPNCGDAVSVHCDNEAAASMSLVRLGPTITVATTTDTLTPPAVYLSDPAAPTTQDLWIYHVCAFNADGLSACTSDLLVTLDHTPCGTSGGGGGGTTGSGGGWHGHLLQ
jgi:hypothetical protein